MRPILAILILSAFVLAACGGQNEPPAKVPVPPASMFMEREYHFSNSQFKDKFLLGYYGNNLADTTVFFYILSPQGDTIYHDQWEARAFLSDSIARNAPDTTASRLIMEEMRALIDKEKPYQDSTMGAASPMAFSYQVHGHGHILTWSTKLNKVEVQP